MTRRDQIIRAWIERDHPRHHWISCISYKGKVHRKSTGTRIRTAAKEFSPLHLLEILRPQAKAPAEHQPELFTTTSPS